MSKRTLNKGTRLQRRRNHIRNHLKGTPERPRLSVRRSLKHIYAQVIDDSSGKTLASASSLQLEGTGGNMEAAKAVGKTLAEQARECNITKVCFDRNGRKYHGRLKALAEAAREHGLEF
ncbi:MAG: 50S ribosomal protein L18 [Candidatus Hydrogenedentota bacterium]